jgi:hypothetical protein
MDPTVFDLETTPTRHRQNANALHRVINRTSCRAPGVGLAPSLSMRFGVLQGAQERPRDASR